MDRQWHITRRMTPGTFGGRSRIATPTPIAFVPTGAPSAMASGWLPASMTVTPDSGFTVGTGGHTFTCHYLAGTISVGNPVVITLPAGWSAPQDSNPAAAGYCIIDNDDGCGATITSIVGQVVTITQTCPLLGNSFDLVYGSGGGAAGVTIGTETCDRYFQCSPADVGATVFVTPDADADYTLFGPYVPGPSTPATNACTPVPVFVGDGFYEMNFNQYQPATIHPFNVAILDQYGNPTSHAGVDITVSIRVNPAGGTLSGTLTRATDARGWATFDDLSIDNVGNGYALKAQSAGLVDCWGIQFNVS